MGTRVSTTREYENQDTDLNDGELACADLWGFKAVQLEQQEEDRLGVHTWASTVLSQNPSDL